MTDQIYPEKADVEVTFSDHGTAQRLVARLVNLGIEDWYMTGPEDAEGHSLTVGVERYSDYVEDLPDPSLYELGTSWRIS